MSRQAQRVRRIAGTVGHCLVSAMLLVVLLASTAASAQSPESLRIIYLANEGFLLEQGETKVLIDALFGDGIDGYAAVPESERTALEAGRPPYDGVDLVLASHDHADHFDAGAVARFLEANPQAVFVSTEQAVEELQNLAEPESTLGARLFGYRPVEGEIERRSIGAIGLGVAALHHGRERPDIQNLGLLVEICGLTVLHVGDTEADAGDMRRAGLDGLAPDVALLPSWFLRGGRWGEVVDDVLRPRRIVAMHLPTPDAPAHYFWGEARTRNRLVEVVQERHAGSFVPGSTGEAIDIACEHPSSVS